MVTIQPRGFDPSQKKKRADFELQYKRDTTLSDVKLHHHDFYELYFLVTGDVTYTIEGRLVRVTPGDILLVSPRELHQLHIVTEREAYERYVLWIDRKYLKHLSTAGTDLTQCLDPGWEGYRNLLRTDPERQRGIYDMVARLYEELHRDGYGGDIMPENLLTGLLVAINRLALQGQTQDEEAARSSQMVSQVVAYIGEHYRQNLSLADLSEHFYVNMYHLSHEFNRLVGTSVHRYIRKKRLLIARQLIAQGQKISQVWPECGFGDYTSFFRAFKAEYGLSPRDYARAVRQNE